MKSAAFIFFLIVFAAGHALAFDLDMTADDEIRKKYNAEKLIEDTGCELPPLPDITDHEQPAEKEIPPPLKSRGSVKIKRGTSFSAVNTTKISDWLSEGSAVKFTSDTSVLWKNYTIPANTVFTGEVVEVHRPQITCNGALVVIHIKSMVYKGHTVPIDARITTANSKKIFFNNIKGNRTYLKTMWKKGNWGRALFGRMLELTVKLGAEGSTVVLSPFPLAYGTICFGLNTVTSPLCAFFSKGGHVSIPAGSKFKIKLSEDAYID